MVAHAQDSSSELLRAKTLILGEEGDEEAGSNIQIMQYSIWVKDGQSALLLD
jgi:hypothetical protein